ncbi:MAG: hypothetical protein OJF49_002171 [Ktedonobacterales bacterium]|jgi:mRNA interferase MazF|nr:MAG: hypothetical protein OJF49_002171 [Ktedonobacterales bacterium]
MVQFDPQVAEEIGKLRPAVVVSVPAVGRLPLRIVVPLTDWKPRYANFRWFIHVTRTAEDGLAKDSGADAFQIESLSIQRFRSKLGIVTTAQIDEIAAAIALCVGMP